jgi:hypothetical protein
MNVEVRDRTCQLKWRDPVAILQQRVRTVGAKKFDDIATPPRLENGFSEGRIAVNVLGVDGRPGLKQRNADRRRLGLNCRMQWRPAVVVGSAGIEAAC